MYPHLIIIFLVTMAVSGQIMAIDTIGQVVRERPKKIDTSPVAVSSTGAIVASYSVLQTPIPLNKIHSWQLMLADKNGKALDGMNVIFISTMPEHLHGMTTKPRVSSTGIAGKYLLEGMNFHMPGWWEITLQISGDGMKEVVHFNLLIGEDVPR